MDEKERLPLTPHIGAMNRIDVPALLSALSIPRRGRVYDLGLELNASIPHNASFTRFAHLFTHTPEETGAASPFQYSADTFIGGLHIGTHMDAFIHVQAENRIFGGALSREARTESGWSRYGMETVPPMVGRGVLIDIPALKGLGRLDDAVRDHGRRHSRRRWPRRDSRSGAAISYWCEPARSRIGGIRRHFRRRSPASDARRRSGSTMPAWRCSRPTRPAPSRFRSRTRRRRTHRAMLVDRGVHLLENLYLERPGADHVTEGLFVELPLKITGATGSWIRPALIV